MRIRPEWYVYALFGLVITGCPGGESGGEDFLEGIPSQDGGEDVVADVPSDGGEAGMADAEAGDTTTPPNLTTCSAPPDPFEPLDTVESWHRLTGFYEGALQFVADGRAYVKSLRSEGRGSGPELFVTTDGRTLDPGSETAIGATAGPTSRAQYAETEDDRYLLVRPNLYRTPRGTGSFTEVEVPSQEDLAVHAVVATNGLVVVQAASRLFAETPGGSWQDVTPESGIGGAHSLAAHDGRIFSEGAHRWPQLLRMETVDRSWKRVIERSVVAPEDWRTVQGTIYGIGSMIERQRVTGNIELVTSKSTGEWNVVSLSTKHPVNPYSLAKANEKLFGLASGRLVRFDLEQDRVEVVTDRVIGPIENLTGLGKMLFADTRGEERATGAVLRLSVEANNPSWSMVPTSKGDAQRLVVTDDSVWARNGAWFRYRSTEDRWSSGWRPEVGDALGRLYGVENGVWGQTESGCVHRLSEDGWSFGFQRRSNELEDDCVWMEDKTQSPRSAVTESEDMFFGFSGSGATDPAEGRALLRWSDGGAESEWLAADGSRAVGRVEAAELATVRGDVWMVDRLGTTDDPPDPTDPQLHVYQDGMMTSFKPEWSAGTMQDDSARTHKITALAGIRGGLYARFEQSTGRPADRNVEFGRWSCEKEAFELLPPAFADEEQQRFLTDRGPVVTSGQKVVRWRPDLGEWRPIAGKLPVDSGDARMESLAVAGGEVYVSLAGGGVWGSAGSVAEGL